MLLLGCTLLVLVPEGNLLADAGNSAPPGVSREELRPTELPRRPSLEEILRDGDYQTSLPSPRERGPEANERDEVSRVWVLPSSGGIVKLLVLGLVLILAFFLILHLWRGAQERRTLREGAVQPATSGPAIELSISLADIDALARSGEFATAVRELLHRVFQSLARQQRLALQRAMTSREIVAAFQLPAEGRRALEHLAMTVELSLFGGDPVEEAQFQHCRDVYQQLERALRQASPSSEAGS